MKFEIQIFECFAFECFASNYSQEWNEIKVREVLSSIQKSILNIY